MADSAPNTVPSEERAASSSSGLVPVGGWLPWWRSAFAIGVALILIALGVANMTLRARWHEVEDGVFWGEQPEGVTAVEVWPGSAGASAGIERGDVVVGVNGQPIRSPGDVVEFYHRAHAGTRLTYQILRLGARQATEVALTPVPKTNSMYFVLASVGLFTLLVGAAVRVRRPRDQATLHFFWLCVAFFGAFTFSFNGPLDRLDWVFYWGDAVAQALLPPLLLHFMLVFPERRPARQSSPLALVGVVSLYVPAIALGTVRLVEITKGTIDGPWFSRTVGLLDEVQMLYLVCTLRLRSWCWCGRQAASER